MYALANKAGFSDDDSHIIAYSSQYVDDNNESQYPRKGGPPQFPFGIKATNYDSVHVCEISGV
jgi:hypothetical protein